MLSYIGVIDHELQLVISVTELRTISAEVGGAQRIANLTRYTQSER